jgi:hypothetical protein
MLKTCALISLCAGAALSADFMTGQAARLVIGQVNFTQQQPGATDANGNLIASASQLGGVGGVAVANDTLFVADANRVSFRPINNRVLVYDHISQTILNPLAPIPAYSGRCPVCLGTADIVVGQPDFTSTSLALSQTGMRLPTGVASDGRYLVVADTANNRVLIWRSIPTTNGQPADVVLGQSNFTTLRPVKVDNKSFRAPQGVWIQNGKLFVADTQNHRVLIWNSVPQTNDTPADLVLGQPNFNVAPEPDLTKATLNAQANTLLNPVSVTSDGVRLYVADLGHNRVLIWNSIPTQNQQPADVVVGQPDFTSAIANNSYSGIAAVSASDTTNKETPVLCTVPNGTDPAGNPKYPDRCAKTLDFPRYALSDGQRLFIADGGNDRVLIFNSIPTQNGQAADVILGQPDEFSSVVSSTTDLFHPLLRQSAADITPTPTSLAWDGTNLYVTDASNRRLLVFTPGENLVPINGVRNSASREIFALGSVTIGGTITANDTVTVTIRDKSYTYKIVKDDTIETILKNLATLINAGSGDPYVFAQAEPSLNLVKLVARKGGTEANDYTIAASTSDKATISAATSGTTLQGGQNATVIAPGTIVSFFGRNLADTTASADPNAESLPLDLAGVQVYFDGIRSPIQMVSPTQINAQVPFEVLDANSISAYVRITHPDGSVTVTTAIAVPIAQQNPGLYAGEGEDPRPAVAFHSSSYATATISLDGLATPGDKVSIGIEDRLYTYVVQDGDTLQSIRDAYIALINANPEEKLVATAASSFTRIRLRAKVPGPDGNGIKLSTSASDGATLVVTTFNTQTCCANVAGAPVTAQNPALPGETIAFYATGLGIVGPEVARQAINTGSKYRGPALNEPVTFVSSLAGGSTANVVGAGLKQGAVGIYEVLLELGTGVTPNPNAQVTISQDIYTSNIVTIPIADPNSALP